MGFYYVKQKLLADFVRGISDRKQYVPGRSSRPGLKARGFSATN